MPQERESFRRAIFGGDPLGCVVDYPETGRARFRMGTTFRQRGFTDTEILFQDQVNSDLLAFLRHEGLKKKAS